VPPPQFPMGLEIRSGRASRDASASSRGADDGPQALGVHASQAAAFAAVDQSILARKVGIPAPKGELQPIPFPDLKSAPADTGSADDSLLVEEEKVEEQKLVSVSHVLTNVIVLQEFLLELAALVQVRAGLFGEVRFN